MSLRSDAIRSLAPGADFGIIGGDLANLIWHSTEIDQPSVAEIEAEMSRLQSLIPMKELRAKRNQLLAETDYLALSDVTLSEDMRTYRQALRDLPDKTSDPANPTWPVKPS